MAGTGSSLVIFATNIELGVIGLMSTVVFEILLGNVVGVVFGDEVAAVVGVVVGVKLRIVSGIFVLFK